VYRRTSNSNNEACVSCSENFQSNYRRAGKSLSSLSFQHEGVCSSSDGCDNPLLGSRAPSPARARQKKRTGRQVTGARKTKTDLSQSQNLNLRANCICLDEPESPVGNRVLVITPNVVLPTCAVRPG
jgi:hypothetical protein